MKITQIETFFVKPRWVFLKMQTDEGVTGWGEPIAEGWSRTTAAAVREMCDYLIGQDPRRIEHHWQALRTGGFYRGGPILTSALSGLEQAMCDITGKWLGVPVHQLLGGRVRDKIRMYGHIHGRSNEELTKSAAAAREAGFTAIKSSVHAPARFIESPQYVEDVAASVAALREGAGKTVDIGIDFHGRITPALAVRLIEAIAPSHPFFVEEPCLCENVDAMARIARSTTVPIATGERLFGKWAFREVLEKGAAVILQPDVSHAGGIYETRKIAALAESYYASLAPHCPLGPIALASCLQVDACTPNFLCQEQVNLGVGYLKTPLVIKNGFIDVPEGPGLGIEVDEEAIKEKLYDGSWATPRLWHDDGSVAEW